MKQKKKRKTSSVWNIQTVVALLAISFVLIGAQYAFPSIGSEQYNSNVQHNVRAVEDSVVAEDSKSKQGRGESNEDETLQDTRMSENGDAEAEVESSQENITVSEDEQQQKHESEASAHMAFDETFVPTHIPIPESVRAIYMTSWVAGTPRLREGIIKLIEDTELNSIVIDIKDDTGKISFRVVDPLLQGVGSQEVRIRDLRALIAELHEKGIYVIGRIATFQDPYYVRYNPSVAVRRASDGGVWADRKGQTWIDPGARDVWEYMVQIGKEAYNAGFDELNYDYIRFPSDGNMSDISYPHSGETLLADPYNGRTAIMHEFFEYLTTELRKHNPYPDNPPPVLSADLFGMTTTNNDDLNIGQKLEVALPYFDYIAPMVYPSHYPDGFIGFANPAAYPYEIISHAMQGALLKIDTLKNNPNTSEVVKNHVRHSQIRPWLQDFNIGATYTSDMVRRQIQATYDQGLDSWMIWDASNTYTQGAFRPLWQGPEPVARETPEESETVETSSEETPVHEVIDVQLANPIATLDNSNNDKKNDTEEEREETQE